MITPKVIIPSVADGFAVRQMGLGTDSYDLTEPYSPGTGIWQSKVLDLGSPKFQPNKTYIFDKSRYNNHGTITGATWVRLPSGLWMLNFDGTDDKVVTISATGIPVAGTNRSILAWVWLDDYGVANPIIRWGENANEKLCWLSTTQTDGYLQCGFYADDHITTTVVGTLAWHRVGATFTGTTSKLYLDGALVSTKANHGVVNTTASNVFIGTDILSTSFLDGKMALQEILSIVFTDAQMANDFNQTRHLFGV